MTALTPGPGLGELAAEGSIALPPGESLADTASAEFTRRQATARRKVGLGELEPGEAERHLRPWLALAARFGADLPELYEEHAGIFPFDRAGEPRAVRLWSADICPPAEIAEALAAARDAAIDRADGGGDPERNARAHRLQTLAIAFGVRPYAYRRPPGAAEQEAA